MKQCPNIDKDTMKRLQSLNIQPNVHNRVVIFYTICIILRLLLAGLSYQLRDQLWLPYLTMIISGFVIYRLHDQLYGQWWWSRPFHFMIMILLFIVSILIIYKKVDSKYISYLLYVDVIGGFIHSLLIERC